MRKLGRVATALLGFLFPIFAFSQTELPRTDKILSQMTLDEKITLLSGQGFNTPAIPRLGIPAIRMTDGPNGVRFGQKTSFPVGMAMAATFNPSVIQEVGAAIARETKSEGNNMILGPCVNMARVPVAGRVFEGFGEDPWLASKITVGYVLGAQSENVIATTKHFAVNDQENRRMDVNAMVDERTLREIHFPPFEAAVKEAKTASIMSAYNKINGAYASENKVLLTDVLKKEWGFAGFVVSDWGATHSAANSAFAGLDIEMPWGTHFGAPLKSAVLSGLVSESVIDEKVQRILSVLARFNLLENPPAEKFKLNKAVQRNVALKAGQESIVLLKNVDHLLPLTQNQPTKVAVIGSAANHTRTGGGGSSYVNTDFSVTPLEGLKQRLAQGSQLSYTYTVGEVFGPDEASVNKAWIKTSDKANAKTGLTGEFFPNENLSGTPRFTRVDDNFNFNWEWSGPGQGLEDHFSIRWSGVLNVPADGPYELVLTHDDGVRFFLDGKKVVDDWKKGKGVATVKVTRVLLDLKANKNYKIRAEYLEDDTLAIFHMSLRAPKNKKYHDPIEDAVELAKKSDVAVIFAGNSDKIESEGFDRASMALPYDQNQMIERVAAANPNTVVVLFAGSPVEMPWKDKVKGIVMAWYLGQETGLALADVLLGNVNPSGKLPISLPKRFEDTSTFKFYPGGDHVEYKEGIFLGYRHFDTRNVEPLFPFGHGLSYTQFAYQNLRVVANNAQASAASFKVLVDITNSGDRAGQEVVQLYVSDLEPKIEKATQELKAFAKISLAAKETKTVELELNSRSFSFWDVATKNWKATAGRYEIRVGTSSRELPLKQTVTLQ